MDRYILTKRDVTMRESNKADNKNYAHLAKTSDNMKKQKTTTTITTNENIKKTITTKETDEDSRNKAVTNFRFKPMIIEYDSDTIIFQYDPIENLATTIAIKHSRLAANLQKCMDCLLDYIDNVTKNSKLPLFEVLNLPGKTSLNLRDLLVVKGLLNPNSKTALVYAECSTLTTIDLNRLIGRKYEEIIDRVGVWKDK
jgi:hypothetical protein